MEKPFILVTPGNIKRISQRIRNETGGFLISEPGPRSFDDWIIDASISYYKFPIVDDDGSFHVDRGHTTINGEGWQTGWENDREYFLRPIPKPTGNDAWDYCRTFSDKLQVGSYEFKIGFQSVVGRGIFSDEGVTLYVPADKPIIPAFTQGLLHIVQEINKTIKKDDLPYQALKRAEIETIVRYASGDIKDGKFFSKNVLAGMQSDDFLDSPLSDHLFKQRGMN